MKTLYLITGPAGVGKSTISKKIAESLPKSCLIEGDDVYHIVVGGYVSPWKEGNHLSFFWKNCISLIENCLAEGYDVVFNYILSKNDVLKLKNNFSGSDVVIKFVALIVDEKTIVERDKLRPQDCQMGERSIVLLKEILAENFNKSNILDSSKLSVEETYQEILKSDRFVI